MQRGSLRFVRSRVKPPELAKCRALALLLVFQAVKLGMAFVFAGGQARPRCRRRVPRRQRADF